MPISQETGIKVLFPLKGSAHTEGRDKCGYAREGYAFSPMFTLGYEMKLSEKESETTWLKLERAD